MNREILSLKVAEKVLVSSLRAREIYTGEFDLRQLLSEAIEWRGGKQDMFEYLFQTHV